MHPLMQYVVWPLGQVTLTEAYAYEHHRGSLPDAYLTRAAPDFGATKRAAYDNIARREAHLLECCVKLAAIGDCVRSNMQAVDKGSQLINHGHLALITH
jgi:hypothetical protein